MARPDFTIATWYDAGLLREYTVAHYGSILAHGGSWHRWNLARRMINRLTKLTGMTADQITADIVADYETNAQ